MEFALFLTSSGEVRKVREYETLAEAEQAAAEDNDALALIYVPPASRAYYRAFERVTLADGSHTWRAPDANTINGYWQDIGKCMSLWPSWKRISLGSCDANDPDPD